MEYGYEDFPSSSQHARDSLLPFDGDRYSRAHKLFRIGGIVAAVVGALATVGVITSIAPPAAPASTTLATTVAPVAALKAAPVALSKVASSAAVMPYQAKSSPPATGSSSSAAQAFDKAGRYIMRDFDRAKPMSSFLPGVGGLWGIPMWAFYVNRGQGLATFGVENKDGGILLFQTAEKTYQVNQHRPHRLRRNAASRRGARLG